MAAAQAVAGSVREIGRHRRRPKAVAAPASSTNENQIGLVLWVAYVLTLVVVSAVAGAIVDYFAQAYAGVRVRNKVATLYMAIAAAVFTGTWVEMPSGFLMQLFMATFAALCAILIFTFVTLFASEPILALCGVPKKFRREYAGQITDIGVWRLLRDGWAPIRYL